MSQNPAAARSQDLANQWLRDCFNFTGDASWNTPRKAKTSTPTADEGRQTGEKRKAQFAPPTPQQRQQHNNTTTTFYNNNDNNTTTTAAAAAAVAAATPTTTT